VIGATANWTLVCSTVFLSQIATYICPSDTSGPSTFKQGSNYDAVVGPQFNWYGNNQTKGAGVGLFADRLALGLKDCTDGSSNTMLFGEALIGDNSPATANGAEFYNCVTWPTGTSSGEGSGVDMVMPNALTSFNTYVSTCNTMKKGTTVAANSRNSYWAAGRMTEGPVTTTLLTPNSKNAECANFTYSSAMYALRSRHSGGVNVLFADGSVRFIKDSVNQTTWWALGTKASGEVVSSDSY